MTSSPHGASGAASASSAWLPMDTECGRLIADRDWTDTPLGPIRDWPLSLRALLGFVLRSRVAMVMLWGDPGIMLYDDAYSAFAGPRHPLHLGKPVLEGWPEVADFNDNVMRVVLAGGTLSYSDIEMTLYRRGIAEQVVMDLDYSPVIGDDGVPAGVLTIVAETTARVAAERAQRVAEAALVAERDRARGVLDFMAEGFVLFDHDFRVVDINAEALRMDQRSRDDIVGLTQAQA